MEENNLIDENNLRNTFKDLAIKDKRNELNSIIMKMDMLLKSINPDNLNYRAVSNYSYNYEDEDEYLNTMFQNVYNLSENLLDYIYDLDQD